ncbi:MAG: PEP-CTERM sorting domain-containing protein [Burkholderiales bacterium]|nr:PEP-CTERM sorting domain-containing protein [Burkholderiales bacterium]
MADLPAIRMEPDMGLKTVFASLFAAAAIGAAGSAVADPNVALGKPVSITLGSAAGAALSTLTDGLFLPIGTEYTTGTVHWTGLTNFEIDLGGLYSISSITLQHDHNDTYLVSYPVGSSVGFAPIGPNLIGGGMNTTTFTFGAPITAAKLNILGVAGDGLYSMSEIQVAGVAIVPEPGSYAMLLAGLGLIAGVVTRRRRTPH